MSGQLLLWKGHKVLSLGRGAKFTKLEHGREQRWGDKAEGGDLGSSPAKPGAPFLGLCGRLSPVLLCVS